MVERASFMDEYIKQLGFSWNMSYEYVPVNPNDPYANILLDSNRDAQSHRIFIPEFYKGTPEKEYRSIVAENMVRAKFIEMIDPIFGGTYFHPSLADMPDFEKWKWDMWYSQQHVEIWANDHLLTYYGTKEGKKLQEETVENYLNQFFLLEQAGENVNNPIIVNSHLMVSASVQRSALLKYRSQINEARKVILSGLEPAQTEKYKNLENIYMKLPRLPLDNVNKAIAIFDITTQQVAQSREISVIPKLVKYEGMYVWDIKE